MTTTITGDLLAIERGIIVHGCNARGKMGAGLAAAIAKKHPGVYEGYLEVFRERGLDIGDIQVFVSPADAGQAWTRGLEHCAPCSTLRPGQVVVNAITQNDYGREVGLDGKPKVYVSYEALELAFRKVRRLARESGLPVYYPTIGCGLAGGEWRLVSSIIDKALGDGVVEHSLVQPTPAAEMATAQARSRTWTPR